MSSSIRSFWKEAICPSNVVILYMDNIVYLMLSLEHPLLINNLIDPEQVALFLGEAMYHNPEGAVQK
eukprot:3749305-Ditylum_brightwellii.AAC.1